MSELKSLLQMRLRRLRNYLWNLKKDSAAKTFVVTTGLLNITALGLWASYESFRFVEGFRAIGADLNNKMISLLFFALLILIVLSTVIITYTTVFTARETRFLLQHPIQPRIVFWAKLLEAISFSSWASLFLCFPVLISFGLLRDAPWPYYLQAAFVLTLFLLFAGLVGASITLVITPLTQRLNPKVLLIGGLGLLVLLGWTFLRSFDIVNMDGENNLLVLDRFMSGMEALRSPFSPNYWATTAVLAASRGQHDEVAFQTGVLLANTLFFVPLLSAYGTSFFNRQWLRIASHQHGRGSLKTRSDRLHRLLSSNPTLAVVTKDFLCFVRDPAQLSQSLLFLLLMVIYSLSLLNIPDYLTSGRIGRFLYFANLCAISMILSSFTSRFLFPLLSLEGRAFWVLGLAPMKRQKLLHQKLILGLAITLGLGLTISTVANAALNTPPWMFVSAYYVMILAAFCLTSLATGLGAAYPSFDEDNPARISVGLGGTLNFFASALSIGVLVFIEASPYLATGGHPSMVAQWLAHLVALAYTVGLCTFVLKHGGRNLQRSEF